MLDNININSYNKKNTLIGNLNPVVRIIITLLFSIFTLIQNDIKTTLALTILTSLLVLLAKIPIRKIYSIIKSLIFFIIFLYIINILDGFSIEKYTIDVLKLLLVMVDANILITVSNINDLNYGLKKVLTPLQILNKTLPNKIAFSITLSIRFIPSLLEEANKILKAYKSRGISIKGSSYKEKYRIIKSFLIILFNNSINRADEIADNMEIREYNINNYEVYDNKPKLKFIDYFFISSYTTILICIIIRGVLL